MREATSDETLNLTMNIKDLGSNIDKDLRRVNARNNGREGLDGPSLMTKELCPTNDREGAIIL